MNVERITQEIFVDGIAIEFLRCTHCGYYAVKRFHLLVRFHHKQSAFRTQSGTSPSSHCWPVVLGMYRASIGYRRSIVLGHSSTMMVSKAEKPRLHSSYFSPSHSRSFTHIHPPFLFVSLSLVAPTCTRTLPFCLSVSLRWRRRIVHLYNTCINTSPLRLSSSPRYPSTLCVRRRSPV